MESYIRRLDLPAIRNDYRKKRQETIINVIHFSVQE